MLSINDFSEKQILFLVTKEGQKLQFKNDNVLITDKNNTVLHQSTCYRLFAVIIVGHITITSGLIERAKKFGFAIVFMTGSFRMYHTVSSTAQANVLLRQKQYSYNDIAAGRNLIGNKILNQRTMLMQLRNKDDNLKQKINKIDCAYKAIDNAESIQSIMGIEGGVSRIYFKEYFDNVLWQGRKPRIKNDMTNALLDIGYTILFCFIECLLALYGFDSYYGILHKQFYMRKSLVCDMVEPFRVIIDRQTKKGINLGQFRKEDFKVFDGKWCLKYEKSSEYGAVFLKEILKYKTDMFLYIQKFYRCMMKETLNSDFPYWTLEGN